MLRSSWRTSAAAVVLVLLAGCAGTNIFGGLLLQSANDGDRVVDGSLVAVAESTKTKIGKLGMAVVASNEGETVRLACSKGTNHYFDLLLTRVQDASGERTRIRVEWQGGANRQDGLQMLGALDWQSHT